MAKHFEAKERSRGGPWSSRAPWCFGSCLLWHSFAERPRIARHGRMHHNGHQAQNTLKTLRAFGWVMMGSRQVAVLEEII